MVSTPCDKHGNYLDPTDPPPPRQSKNDDNWEPFDSRAQYELAHFLFTESASSVRDVDHLMDIWAAHCAPFDQSAPFDNDNDLKQRIDAINLEEVPWSSYSIRYTGEVPLLRPSAWMKKTYEVWYRDPRQIIHNILANEDFNGEFDYTPFREMRDGKREWSDFMSGNWAWNQADEIAKDEDTHGAMFVPIILGSDKTTVSIASGQTEFYPLYFSIGNVHNNVRRCHRNALVLIGFLALPKGSRKDDRSVEFRRFRRQLFHSSISAILRSLHPYMSMPDVIKCPDGHFRRAIYGIGPYIADYPEQVLVAGVVYGWCVRCIAPAKDLDENFGNSMYRSREHADLCSELLSTTELWEKYGLLDDFTPFTHDFPRADIYEIISPDILHQVIKGGFKDHLVAWVDEYLHLVHTDADAEDILDDIDRRIALAPHFPGLRRFKEGRRFKQWTGADSKALMKVYISAIEGHVPAQMVRAFSAYIDFAYLVRQNVINTDTLDAIDESVERFHHHRLIFQETGVRSDTTNRKAFSLPRQHSMVHYRAHIENFGAPNGLCSSITESKHIVAVKRPWRRSGKYKALKQMLVINERMDKIAAAHRDFTARGMLHGTCLSHAQLKLLLSVEGDKDDEGDEGEDDEGEDGEDGEDDEGDKGDEGEDDEGEDDEGDEGEDDEGDEGEDDEGKDDEGDEGDDNEGDAEGDEADCGPLEGPPIYNEVTLAEKPASRYNTKSFVALGNQIGQANLSDLVRKFLYFQGNPEDNTDPINLNPNACPEAWGVRRIRVFHSARAVFCAPSNPCGTGGMYHEMIRSTPMWSKCDIKAPRRDCVYISNGAADPDAPPDGFRALLVARVYLFFSFRLQETTYPCALIRWYSTLGDDPDPDTGMWIVQPEDDANGYRNMAVVHIDSIMRGAHLLAIFGPDFVDHTIDFTQTLDAFSAFYANKYVDHHAHETVF